jgi:hypothetical protein
MKIGGDKLRWGEAPKNCPSPSFWAYEVLSHEMCDVYIALV